MLTTNEKYTIESQKPRRKEIKHNTKENIKPQKERQKEKGTLRNTKQLENKV